MDVTGETMIKATPEGVWTALQDPEVLKACIPGCETATGDAQSGIDAHIALRKGLLRLSVSCRIEIADAAPPETLTLRARGANLISKGAGCDLRVDLSPENDGRTRVGYTATAQVNSAISKAIGNQLDDFATRAANGFFDRLKAALEA